MLKRARSSSALLAATLVVGLLGFSRSRTGTKALDGRMTAPGWHAIAWPFPRDGFAARPRLAQRRRLDVYVRPKFGFCANCDTGVVDDAEVDQVTDVDLLDEKFTPVRTATASASPTCSAARGSTIATKNGTAHRRGHRRQLQVRPDRGARGRQGQTIPRVASRRTLLESNTVQVWLNQLLEGRYVRHPETLRGSLGPVAAAR